MIYCNVQLNYAANGFSSLFAIDVDTVTDIICITDPAEVFDRICKGEWYPPIVEGDIELDITYEWSEFDPKTLLEFHKSLQKWYDDNIEAIIEDGRRREDYK